MFFEDNITSIQSYKTGRTMYHEAKKITYEIFRKHVIHTNYL